MEFSKIGQAAAESAKVKAALGGSTRELPREGIALVRLRDYIETGKHDSPNPAYKASYKAMLVFELLHPDHMIEINGDQVPMIITHRVNVTVFIQILRTTKSR